MYEISFDVNVSSTVIMFITHLQYGDRILFVMLTNCHVYVLCICKILIANIKQIKKMNKLQPYHEVI